MPNPTTPAPLEPSTCPDCGGATRQAFGPSRRFVSCTKCGHVFPATEPPTLPVNVAFVLADRGWDGDR